MRRTFPIRIAALPIAVALTFSTTSAQTPPRVKRGMEAVGSADPLSAAGPKRRALVVGNDTYTHQKQLRNAVNDARAVSTTLRELDFVVTELDDANLKDLKAGVQRFFASIQPGDVALFFYSGHGIQINNVNYLLPVDFNETLETQVQFAAEPAQAILDGMGEKGARLSLMVLDACRNNPLARVGNGKSLPKGLAQMQSAAGTFIAFATAAGATASDQSDAANGLYTTHFLKVLEKPGLSYLEVFRQTGEAVAESSGHQQIPWMSGAVGGGNFVFREPGVLDHRLEALNAEIRRLKNQQASADAEATANQTAEQARQAGLAKKVRDAELERLAGEARNVEAAKLRAGEIDAEVGKLADADRKRQQDLADAEELARNLRAQVRQAPKVNTLDEAHKRVDALNRQLADVRTQAAAGRKKALDDLEAAYRPLREMLAKDPAVDEFGAPEDNAKAMSDARAKRQEHQTKLEAEKQKIESQYAAKLANRPETEEIQRLSRQTFTVVEPAKWVGAYDNVNQLVTVESGGATYVVPVPREKARELGAIRDAAMMQFTRTFDGALVASVKPELVGLRGEMFPGSAIPMLEKIQPRAAADLPGVWTDRTTGLMWPAAHDGKTMNWADANASCSALGLAGHLDWRLPTINELKAIYDASLPLPHVRGIKISDRNFWAWSSERHDSWGEAWVFGFLAGGRNSDDMRHSDGLRALCVRRAGE